MNLIVIDAQNREKLPGIPTPMLASEASQYGHDAFYVPNDGASKDRIPGVWYMKDPPGKVSPDGMYRKVRVVHVFNYEVDVELQATDPSITDGEQPEPWRDYVFVEAIDEADARSMAYEKGHAMVAREYPDAATGVNIIRVAKAALQ